MSQKRSREHRTIREKFVIDHAAEIEGLRQSGLVNKQRMFVQDTARPALDYSLKYNDGDIFSSLCSTLKKLKTSQRIGQLLSNMENQTGSSLGPDKATVMKFDYAMTGLLEGSRIRRKLWPTGAFVVAMPELQLPPYNTADATRKVNDRTAKWIGEDTPLNCQPYCAIYLPGVNVWQPGWIPSTQDIFADDWQIFAE